VKIVAVSDLHVHPYRLCSRDAGKDRLHDGLSALRQTFDMARTHGCPWGFCGDLKMPKLSWPQEALTGALELFEEFDDVPKLMLPGNHDGDAAHVGGSGLAPFKKHALVIEQPAIVEWAGPTVAVLPWQAQRDAKTLFSDARRLGVTTLLGHGFVAGVLLGPSETRLPGHGLQLGDFGVGDPFSCVILGDVHKGQRLSRVGRKPPVWIPWCDASGLDLREQSPWRGEVLYPGSPYQQNWGERNDGPKGALLIDTDTGAVTLLPVQAPRHILAELPSLRFDVLEGLGRDAKTWEGHFVRLQVPETILDKSAAKGIIEKLQTTAKARWFHVEPIRTRTTEIRTPIRSGMGSTELLQTYLAARKFGGDVSDAAVLSAGLRLLEERA